MADSEVWLETREAAAAAGVTLRALYGMVDRGEIPAHKRARRLLFRLSDVEEAREAAGEIALAQRGATAEKLRALDLVSALADRHRVARQSRDAAISRASREHGASLREIATATGLSAMTVKRILGAES